MSIKSLLRRTCRPPKPPCTPGISPMPSPTRITLIATIPVLLPSTSRLSYALSMPNDLVAATLLKSSRTFHSNITQHQSCFGGVNVLFKSHHDSDACSRLLVTATFKALDTTSVTIGLHTYADMLDCLVSFFFFSYTVAHVRYNLVSISLYDMDLTNVSCTILSGVCLVYNINLRATTTTILSIRGVTIPINLVSSATDSI